MRTCYSASSVPHNVAERMILWSPLDRPFLWPVPRDNTPSSSSFPLFLCFLFFSFSTSFRAFFAGVDRVFESSLTQSHQNGKGPHTNGKGTVFVFQSFRKRPDPTRERKGRGTFMEEGVCDQERPRSRTRPRACASRQTADKSFDST